MAKTFDATRLTEVRKHMMSKSPSSSSSQDVRTTGERMIQSATTRGPLHYHVILKQKNEGHREGSSMGPCGWKGDYELYKEQQKMQQCAIEREDIDSFTSISTSSSSTSTSSSSSYSHMSEIQVCQQVYANERLIQELRQRVKHQERQADSLYSQIAKARQHLEILRYELVEEYNLFQRINRRASPTNKSVTTNRHTSSSTTTPVLVRAAMVVGLLVHLWGGSPNCLAVAVFGWWLTE
jgi:hypothetical protein